MGNRKLLSALSDLLFPPLCPICGEKCLKDGALCGKCLDDYSKEELTVCPVCGAAADRCQCGTGKLTDTLIAGKPLVALTFYFGPERRNGATEKMIRLIKTGYDKPLTDLFAREISGRLLSLMKAGGEEPGEWFITYPPRSAENLRKYGFDQCEAAAKSISKYTGIPWGKTLYRTEGSVQKSLGRTGRERNVSSIALLRRTDVRGKNVIIFDDVITTGATVKKAAALLDEAGAVRVFPVCIARTAKEK